MPRKPCVTADEIFEVVKDRDCFIESKLKSRSDSIWVNICRALKDRIRVMNLYLYLKQNRNDILSRIMTYKGISIAEKEHSFTSPDTTINITGQNESVESIHSDNEITCVKTSYKCSSILYDITVDAETWQYIGPKPVIYYTKSIVDIIVHENIQYYNEDGQM